MHAGSHTVSSAPCTTSSDSSTSSNRASNSRHIRSSSSPVAARARQGQRALPLHLEVLHGRAAGTAARMRARGQRTGTRLAGTRPAGTLPGRTGEGGKGRRRRAGEISWQLDFARRLRFAQRAVVHALGVCLVEWLSTDWLGIATFLLVTLCLVWRLRGDRDSQILKIYLKKLVELLRQKVPDEANHFGYLASETFSVAQLP